ncbi:MAG: nicotinate-nucleotide--dimethylbenzimidazole phosphoribosyltransferase [Eubacteriaceae bacterium]|nr:nicotinate-nucleotide--dimethylbenzimidazole phosphoribosyltransferase [Eubacteriaceae bacterium]
MKNLKEELFAYVDGISPANSEVIEQTKGYALNLLKIPGSLGRLEDISYKLAGISGEIKKEFGKKCIIIMSSDNGIVDQGVSSAPQSITKTLTEVFTRFGTGVGAISKTYGNDLFVYNIGIKPDIDDPKVINVNLMRGTNDFSLGAAMDYETAIKGMLIGIKAVKDAIDAGYEVIGTGEMGIGNTSTSTAVICSLAGENVDNAVGKGTGMTDDTALIHKIKVIQRGIDVNRPDKNDPIDVVAKVGGLDIAGLVGIYIGCAYYKVPVVIDGYISSAAYYAAYSMNPLVADYAIESHKTEEPGYAIIAKNTGLKPMFDMNMRLGEGSGCPFTFFAIDCAQSVLNNMFTFEMAEASTEYTDKVADLKF